MFCKAGTYTYLFSCKMWLVLLCRLVLIQLCQKTICSLASWQNDRDESFFDEVV